MTVVNLNEYREENTPHLTGRARCIDCHHEWITVCPIGTIAFFECPECGLFKGRMKFEVIRDGPHWKCNCGNDLFFMKPDGMYCPICGEFQNGY
jgi:hypothetical protein